MTASQTTHITAAGTADSPDRYGCPGVHEVADRSERYVITRQVDDPHVLDALADHIGHDNQGRPEQVGSTPPWVPCELMDLLTLGAFMDDHLHRPGDSVFRCEVVDSDGVTDPNWDRWRDGAMQPDWRSKQEWLNQLAADSQAGIRHSRVRILPADITEYQIYECTWGFALNTPAGEDIRIFRAGEHHIPAGLLAIDYWTVNDAIALPVLYAAGQFIGGGYLPADRSAAFLHDAASLWAAAEPFTAWWARHTELHDNRTAA